jgi:hypothetical protein
MNKETILNLIGNFFKPKVRYDGTQTYVRNKVTAYIKDTCVICVYDEGNDVSRSTLTFDDFAFLHLGTK